MDSYTFILVLFWKLCVWNFCNCFKQSKAGGEPFLVETFIVITFQGTVEATGTFSELQESGRDFAKQLDLDVEKEDRELKEGSVVDHDKSHGSCEKMMRQNSETSQVEFKY